MLNLDLTMKLLGNIILQFKEQRLSQQQYGQSGQVIYSESGLMHAHTQIHTCTHSRVISLFISWLRGSVCAKLTWFWLIYTWSCSFMSRCKTLLFQYLVLSAVPLFCSFCHPAAHWACCTLSYTIFALFFAACIHYFYEAHHTIYIQQAERLQLRQSWQCLPWLINPCIHA